EHEDSAGHRGVLRAGDVQWMTAGAGVIHSEMPSRRIREEGGRVHGFQIWVNLPARLKMARPRYQEVPAQKIPQAATADGKERVVHYGPFVMNSDEEIVQAVRDFQSGRMGEITRTARVD